MKVLVTGASGQVGWELSRSCVRKGFEILALDRINLDITDQSAIYRKVRESGVSLVVNAAASIPRPAGGSEIPGADTKE